MPAAWILHTETEGLGYVFKTSSERVYRHVPLSSRRRRKRVSYAMIVCMPSGEAAAFQYAVSVGHEVRDAYLGSLAIVTSAIPAAWILDAETEGLGYVFKTSSERVYRHVPLSSRRRRT